MAYEQQDRWHLTDIEVPFKCVLWWMMKVGFALLIVGGAMALIVEGVITLHSFIISEAKVADARMPVTQVEQYRPPQPVPPSPVPQMQLQSRSGGQSSFFNVFDTPQQPTVSFPANHASQANVRAAIQPVPAIPAAQAPAATPQPSKGVEFSIFRDKPQQITTKWGTHRIWIHDYGSETISFSIDGQQPVKIKKANGSDVTGDNRVMIFHDDQLALFHVNSPRAPLNCSLIMAFPVVQL